MSTYDKGLTDEVVALFDNGDALVDDGLGVSFHDELLSRFEDNVEVVGQGITWRALVIDVMAVAYDMMLEYDVDTYHWLGSDYHDVIRNDAGRGVVHPDCTLVNWGRVVSELWPDIKDILGVHIVHPPVFAELVEFEADVLGLGGPPPGFGPAGPVVSLAACLFAQRGAN